jgi:hypothetical protein
MGMVFDPQKALRVVEILETEGVPSMMTPAQAAAVCERYGVHKATFAGVRKNRKDVSIVSVATRISLRGSI